MRALATALMLTAVAAGAAPGQAVSGMRATVRIPPILELTQEAAEAGSGAVLLRVRANVPWRLTASLPSSGLAGGAPPVAVDVAGARPAGHMVREGAPVEIARSAERGDVVVELRVRWARGTQAAVGPAGAAPRLLYSLDEGR